MAYTPITPLPAVPDANDGPDTFTEDADAFLGALPAWANQVNASGAYIDLVAAAVDSDASAAEDSATDSALSASQSAASAAIAVTAVNFKGLWSSLTGALAVPASVYHNSQYWQLLENVADVTAETPGVSTKWALAVNSSGRTVISGPFTVNYPGRYLITNTATITIPTPVGVQNGAVYNFATVLGQTPTLATVTDGFKYRGGLDNQILLTVPALELTAYNNKYEV